MSAQTNANRKSGRTREPWIAISWSAPPSAGRTTVAVMDESDVGVDVVAIFTKQADALIGAAAPELLASAECDRAYNAKPVDWETLKRHGWKYSDLRESAFDFCARKRNAAIAKATEGET